MTGRILIRPGDAPEETLAEIRAHAEAQGFSVTLQTRIGRHRVTEREGFTERLAQALAEKERDKLSLRATARKLDIGVATLHRLLHAEEPAEGRGRRPVLR